MKLPTLGRPLASSLLLAALVAGAGFAAAAAWADLSTALEEREVGADLLSQTAAAGRRAGAPEGAAAEPSLFVEADSDTLAAAKVDAAVRSLAAGAGDTVLSSRAEVKHEDGAPGDRIEVQAVIEGGNDALQALLFQLEAGAPLVLVDAATIHPVEAAGDPQAPTLRASLTLSAYWRTGPKPASPTQ